MSAYIWNLLEWISQGLNTVLLAGNPNMTVSARCWLNRERTGWALAYRVINRIFFWQADHCRLAHEAEVRRYQFPPAYRASVSAAAPGIYYPPGTDPTDQ